MIYSPDEMNDILNTHTDAMRIKNFAFNINSFQSQADCNQIVGCIQSNYDSKTQFNLIIETKDLSVADISIHCLYSFSTFLNSIKKNKCHYLKKTTIKIYNNYCYDLLYYLFTYLSSPVAIVEVILCKRESVDNIDMSSIAKIKQYFPKN